MQLYLNYKHRSFVFTQEMLVAMGRPAYVALWLNPREGKLLFESKQNRQKDGACWKIPDKVYEDKASYAVGYGAPFVLELVESLGKDVTVAVQVKTMNASDMLDMIADKKGRKPSGIVMVADLNDIETSFYTDELDTVYDQDTQGRWKIGEDKRMFVGP